MSLKSTALISTLPALMVVVSPIVLLRTRSLFVFEFPVSVRRFVTVRVAFTDHETVFDVEEIKVRL